MGSAAIKPNKPAPEKDQDKTVLKTVTTAGQKTNKISTEINKVQPKLNNTAKAEPSSTTPSSQPPTAAKRNSKVINKLNNVTTKPAATTGKLEPLTSNPVDKPGPIGTENNKNSAQ